MSGQAGKPALLHTKDQVGPSWAFVRQSPRCSKANLKTKLKYTFWVRGEYKAGSEILSKLIPYKSSKAILRSQMNFDGVKK